MAEHFIWAAERLAISINSKGPPPQALAGELEGPSHSVNSHILSAREITYISRELRDEGEQPLLSGLTTGQKACPMRGQLLVVSQQKQPIQHEVEVMDRS